MERHIKAGAPARYQEIIHPGTMRFLDFARLQLEKGESFSHRTDSREAVLDIFGGSISVSVEYPGGKQTFSSAGSRSDVFAGPPAMIYIPPQSRWEAVADTKADVGVFSAPSQALGPPALAQGNDVVANHVGRDNWARTVYSALADNISAERLLAGETLNPPGNWSSYPPHKHDQHHPPNEAVLEEVYFFRVKPSQGFGLMWTYTAEEQGGFSTAFVIEDGDTVLLPRGYHPVVAAPGYQLHYTWVLAGEERRYGAWADDPRHAWIRNQ